MQQEGRVFCARHAAEGMTNLCSKQCAHKGCATRPTYGVEGSKNPEFCARHAAEGMVDVQNKKCAHQRCGMRAGYGVHSSNKAEFCAKHAKDGMVNFRRGLYVNRGRAKRALRGAEGGDTRKESAGDTTTKAREGAMEQHFPPRPLSS